jgi:hypothetical protein
MRRTGRVSAGRSLARARGKPEAEPFGHLHAIVHDVHANQPFGLDCPFDAMGQPGNALGNDRNFLSTFFVDKSVDEALEKSLRA